MMRFFAVLVVVALLGCAEQAAEKGPPVPPRYTMTAEGVHGRWGEVLTLRDSETGEEWRVLYRGGDGRAMALLSHEVSP